MWWADGGALAVSVRPAMRWPHARGPPPCAVAAAMEALRGCGERKDTCTPFMTFLVCDGPTRMRLRLAGTDGDELETVRMLLMLEASFNSPAVFILGHILVVHAHSLF